MRNPIEVLKNLEKHAKDKQYKFERLYRNLYNPDFYMLAYKNISKSQGSMTEGTDGMTLKGMTKARIGKIILSLKNHTYQPNPARRLYIEKKNSKSKRPLGIPSTNDRLVQEIVRMLLESIYEPTFSKNSHGFRPKRSCHTALFQVQSSFIGAKWIVEGDIKACFDSFDHHITINLLRKRIKDEYFISLMWKFLRAGYMEQWRYSETYSGTPQGAGVSPILSNIYLSELDEFLSAYKEKFDKGACTNRTVNKEYTKLNYQYSSKLKKYNLLRNELPEQVRKEMLKAVLKARQQRAEVNLNPVKDETFKRLQYNRYADDFIVGIIGSEKDAQALKTDIANFLKKNLNLTLSLEKTKVTHSAELVRYLGYDITVTRNKHTKRDKNGRMKREWYGNVELYLPKDKWMSKLLEYKTFRIVTREDSKEIWKTLHRGWLVNKSDIDILSQFNSEIRGIYNFYKLAKNVSILNSFAFIMGRSMYKTFACKYKSTASKMRQKYSKNGIFGITYNNKSGEKRVEFYHDGFKQQNNCFNVKDNVDVLPNYRKYMGTNSLAMRLLAGKCELCGIKTEDIHMHHIKTLKGLKPSNSINQIMIDNRRKSVALCTECYRLS